LLIQPYNQTHIHDPFNLEQAYKKVINPHNIYQEITITVGATQSSVLISGFSQLEQTDPYPLTNGSTIAVRYSMLQRITSVVNNKKDGLIKYVPASGIDPATGTWQKLDIDTQPLTQFAGNLPVSRIEVI
jgi:hypothetical protein